MTKVLEQHQHIPSWVQLFKVQTSKNKKNKGGALKTTPSVREKLSHKYRGYFYVLGENTQEAYRHIIEEHSLEFQRDSLLQIEKETLHFTGLHGYVWILKIKNSSSQSHSHSRYFAESKYSQARDGAGSLLPVIRALQIKSLKLELVGLTEEEKVGLFVGLDMGAYQFRAIFDGKNHLEGLPEVEVFESFDLEPDCKTALLSAQRISQAVNWARHLTNLPGNILNPNSMAEMIQQKFNKSESMKVEVWNADKLKAENMGLHLAVGQGALHPPCMVHIKYRPNLKSKAKNTKEESLVFVGKGITFDTGGLDLKPSAAMRLMKKDMGGSAAVVALSQWVEQVEFPYACDFYLALAENSVSERSMRPGDIYTSKSGQTVEITNTDAEGRLVLADVITAALDNPHIKVKYLIDVATLTGAIKVALGSELAGLFTNNDELADLIGDASYKTGDLCWRMPLVPKYIPSMSSSVATLTNSVEGFGGAITAALFLEKFVRDVPWAHLDVYAWNDKSAGALSFVGGSGQGVQNLIGFLSLYESQNDSQPKSKEVLKNESKKRASVKDTSKKNEINVKPKSR